MPRNVRAEMIEGAAASLARRGVEGTPVSVVLQDTDAPRGSVYHHFPGGRDELITEAVRFAADRFVTAVRAAPRSTVAEFVRMILAGWRELLTTSQFTAGCTVAAVAIGAGPDDGLRTTSSDAFRAWTHAVTDGLVKRGAPRRMAKEFADALIASIEGALMLSCAFRSIEPFDRTAALVELGIDRLSAASASQ